MNLKSKRVTPEQAYEVWYDDFAGTWAFVLKHYKNEENEQFDPYCHVLAMVCKADYSLLLTKYPGDVGDTYLFNVTCGADKLEENPYTTLARNPDLALKPGSV